MSHGTIVIVGGSGAVGSEVARSLAPDYPGRIRVAGRRLDRAVDVAEGIGHGAAPLVVDARESASWQAIKGATLVLVCLDQQSNDFARFCLASGIHYVDISAETAFHQMMADLQGVARGSGASAVLSVGLVPGLSNLLAAAARARAPSAERLDIVVELGLGDHHGGAAIEWMLDHLDTPFDVGMPSSRRSTRGFGEWMDWHRPGGRARRVYRFDFPDQHSLTQTLQIPVASWFCLSSSVATRLVATLVQIGAGRWLRWPPLRRLVVALLQRVHFGSDGWSIAVRASGPQPPVTATLRGRREGRCTAAVAATTCRRVLDGRVPPGVWHLDQVDELEGVLASMDARDRVSTVTWLH